MTVGNTTYNNVTHCREREIKKEKVTKKEKKTNITKVIKTSTYLSR